MNSDALLRIQELGDLGLACVLCLSIDQHGIILARAEDLDDAARELAEICSGELRLKTVVINCGHDSDLDDFRESVLIQAPPEEDASGSAHAAIESTDFGRASSLDDRRIADVIVAKNLNLAPHVVQIQALELVRNKRIYTRAAMHSAGGHTLLIALNEHDSKDRMDPFLNDIFAIAHFHGLADDNDSDNDSLDSRLRGDSVSFTSVIRGRRQASRAPSMDWYPLGPEVLLQLKKAVAQTTMTAEVAAHLQNVIVAARLHRFSAGGISALATRHMRMVCKAMAVLHGSDFVTPAIIALAAQKVYLHRLVLADATNERSLRWGSDPAAVQEKMRGVTVEKAIDSIVSTVHAPI